jgi:hypothetical protein
MSDKLRKLVAVVLGSTDLNEAMSALNMARRIQPDGKLPAPLYGADGDIEGVDWRTLLEAAVKGRNGEYAEGREQEKALWSADESEAERRIKEDPEFLLSISRGIDLELMKTDEAYAKKAEVELRSRAHDAIRTARRKQKRAQVKAWLEGRLAQNMPRFVTTALQFMRDQKMLKKQDMPLVETYLGCQAIANAQAILDVEFLDDFDTIVETGRRGRGRRSLSLSTSVHRGIKDKPEVDIFAHRAFDDKMVLERRFVAKAFRDAVSVEYARQTKQAA